MLTSVIFLGGFSPYLSETKCLGDLGAYQLARLFGQGASKIHFTHFLCVRVIEVKGNAGVFVLFVFLWVLGILDLDFSSCVADILLFLQSNFKYLIVTLSCTITSQH